MAVLAIITVAAFVIAQRGDRNSENRIDDSNSPAADNNANGSTLSVHRLESERRPAPEYALFRAPAFARNHSFNNETVLVWGGDHQLADGLQKNVRLSNISKSDYAGAESCRSCHAENYAKWSHHAHRWMNVLADEESVKGDFSGSEEATIRYRGGLGEFYRDGDDYMMKLSRDGIVRNFKINPRFVMDLVFGKLRL